MNPFTQLSRIIFVLLVYVVLFQLIFNWSLSGLFHVVLTFKQALGVVILTRISIK